MTRWFSSTIARAAHSIRAAQSRLMNGSQLAACRACGRRRPMANMSEIPFHGFFCNDEEAIKYWNKNYELDTAIEPKVAEQSVTPVGSRFSQPS